MRKLFTLLLALVLILALSTGAYAYAAGDYPDIPDKGYWSYEAVVAAIENALLHGDDEGKIDPKGTLTRAQAAAVLVRAMGATETADISSYEDIDATAWYSREVSIAVAMKVMMGRDNKFYPDEAMTREMMAVALARVLALEPDADALKGFLDADSISDWAVDGVSAMVAAGYMQGSDNRLFPNDKLTREEYAQFLYNIIQKYIDVEGVYTDEMKGNLLIRKAGVTLKGLNIAGDLIIGDGVGDGDITLDDCVLNGRLVVRGGGENSIIIRATKVGSVVISKIQSGPVRIATENSSEVDAITIVDGSDDVIVEGKAKSIAVNSDVDLEVRGTVETVTVDTNNTNVVITESANVSNLHVQSGDAEAESNVKVNIKGSVESLDSAAPKATIIIAKEASVNEITITGDATKVEGDGKAGVVIVNADNAAITTPETKIVNNGLTPVITAEGEVAVGRTETTTNSGGVETTTNSGGVETGSSVAPVVISYKYDLEISISDDLGTVVTNSGVNYTKSEPFYAAVFELAKAVESELETAFSGSGLRAQYNDLMAAYESDHTELVNFINTFDGHNPVFDDLNARISDVYNAGASHTLSKDGYTVTITVSRHS